MTGGPKDEVNRRPPSQPRKSEEDPVSPRPADLSAWTPDDFRSALADRDILLLQAVPLLGRSGGDADANAKLLLELLETPTEGAAHRGMAQPIRGLAEAVVTALAANPSEVARNALKEILLGTRRTNLDDRMFTTAALAGIVTRQRRGRCIAVHNSYDAQRYSSSGPKHIQWPGIAKRMRHARARLGIAPVASPTGAICGRTNNHPQIESFSFR